MFDIKENLKKLPETPGVYLHKDKVGQVIYVGKAVNLKRRVSSYFVNSKNHSGKVRRMVQDIEEFEYINCKTEMEALILECNLIKKYAPKYNVLLRDDKTYPYIKVTLNEEFPRVIKTRIIYKDGAKYFGPYSDAAAVNQSIELVNKIFKLKRCASKSFPEGFRPCLNYHIGECPGICTGNIPKEKYMEKVNGALDFLNGKHKEVVYSLEEKMKEYAENMNFEEAAVYRDYISSVKAISETQRVTMVNGKDLDIVMAVGDGTCIVLYKVRDGKLSGRETFPIGTEDQKGKNENSYDELISSFIKQYYVQLAVPPHEILVDKPIEETELISEFLSENAMRGNGGKDRYSVRIFTPERGDKKALLDLARKDIRDMERTLKVRTDSALEREKNLAAALSEILGVKKDTFRIESYDISNTNGVDTVGAMVVFQNLKPVKKSYRRFKIRTVEGPNDYASLQEMMYRRFKRALDGDESFLPMPDLILMDGGQGQVTSAEKILVALGVHIPVLGMAKDDSHRTKALVNGIGDEILLKNYPLLFSYCGNIQEEVHRFAIEYHRSLHSKNSIGSVLDNIPGIGPKKRTALLTFFKSIDEIKSAEISELIKCPGISVKDAESIKKFFT